MSPEVSLTIGGSIVLLMIREMFKFLKDRKASHNQEDLCKGLEGAIEKLDTTLDSQTQVLLRIVDKLDRIHELSTHTNANIYASRLK